MLDIPNRHTAVQTSCRNRTQGRYMYSFYSLQINSSQFNGAKIIKIVAHRQHFSKKMLFARNSFVVTTITGCNTTRDFGRFH